tara:strand:- start:1190 stop:2026 length:837 start_codon:yes stop_codon:yes gene_type:complete
MSLFNNITHDFFETINNFGSNPFVLVVLIFIILIYYVIFAFLGNTSSDSENFPSGGFIFIEAILWALFILLVFINGLSYFFSINLVTELNNVFSKTPEIKIESTLNQDISGSQSQPLDLKEVYHIPGNRFTYHDAKAVCNAFDGELANYDQLALEQKKGASWCSFGWTKDQLGLYPTSQNHFDKLQKKEGHEYDCGLPGINGGHVSNPHIKLGSNCYGNKPKISDLENNLLKNDELYPKTQKEKLFDQRVDYWKNRVGNILISPFNKDNWFKLQNNSI